MALIPTYTQDVVLKLSPEEARREAIGKALGLVGTLIGVTGTLIALSVNPAVKAQAGDLYSKVPKAVKDNQTAILIALGLGAAAAAYWWIGRGVKKEALGRYGK